MIEFISNKKDFSDIPYWVVEKNNPIFGDMLFEKVIFYYEVKKSFIFNKPELFIYIPSIKIISSKNNRIGIFSYYRIFQNTITKDEFQFAIMDLQGWFQSQWNMYNTQSEFHYFNNTLITFDNNWKIQTRQTIRKMKLKKLLSYQMK